MTTPVSRYERYIYRIKDHPVGAVVVVAVIGGLSLISAAANLKSLFFAPDDRATETLAVSAHPQTDNQRTASERAGVAAPLSPPTPASSNEAFVFDVRHQAPPARPTLPQPSSSETRSINEEYLRQAQNIDIGTPATSTQPPVEQTPTFVSSSIEIRDIPLTFETVAENSAEEWYQTATTGTEVNWIGFADKRKASQSDLGVHLPFYPSGRSFFDPRVELVIEPGYGGPFALDSVADPGEVVSVRGYLSYERSMGIFLRIRLRRALISSDISPPSLTGLR